MPLIPVFGGRGRWLSESEASLVCRVSSRTAGDTQRNRLKQTNPKNKTMKIKKPKILC